jgi:succinate dehydrogenase hydrophobic anchor subunit
VATIRTRPEGTSRRRLKAGEGRVPGWWLATTLTGVALLFLLGAHMVANHFVVHAVGGLRSYRQVLEYLSNPAIFAIESLFLLFVTVHAMLGLRGVILDLDPGPRTLRWVDAGLAVLGVATLGYGYFVLGTLASRA